MRSPCRLLTLVLPIQNVVAVMTVLTIGSSLGHWLGSWRQIVWAEILRAAPFTLIGVVAGLFLFRTLDAHILTKAFGVFVILYAIYLGALRLEKNSFRVTITTILMTQAVMRVTGYFKIGFYDTAALMMVAAALPLILIGSRLGGLTAGRINQLLFNRIVGAVLMCSGVLLLFK
jgi:hypothetical protein